MLKSYAICLLISSILITYMESLKLVIHILFIKYLQRHSKTHGYNIGRLLDAEAYYINKMCFLSYAKNTKKLPRKF